MHIMSNKIPKMIVMILLTINLLTRKDLNIKRDKKRTLGCDL